MNNQNLFNKSQISIFITLFVMIIILFVFFFSTNSANQDGKIELAENQYSEADYDFRSLEEDMNFCLENAIQKSIIIASYRGGLIYNMSGTLEKYTQSPVYSTYREKILEPYKLTIDEVLYYTSPIIPNYIFPRDSYNDLVDTNSGNLIIPAIVPQFQTYILDEFLNCVDFQDYRNKGFRINSTKVTTKVISKIDSNTLKIEEIEGKTGDTLVLEFENYYEEGQLKIDGSGDYLFETTNDPFTSIIDFSDYSIYNKDLSVSLKLNFNAKFVEGTIFFPVIFGNSDVALSSLSVNYKEETTFSNLFKISNELIKKKIRDRTLDYSDSTNVNAALANVQDIDTTGVLILENRIVDESYYKRYVYSLRDTNSQFLGEPLRFQFAYENTAPYLDFNHVSSNTGNLLCYTHQDEVCSFLFTNSVQITTDLSEYDFSLEQRDLSQIRYQILDNPNVGYDFTLSSSGEVNFLAHNGGIFDVKIRVTDGEAYNDYTLRFISDSVENDDNTDAQNCLVVSSELLSDPDLSTYYPINNHFKSSANNLKIFDGIDTDGTTSLPFFYSLQQNNVPDFKPLNPHTKIKLSSTCVSDPSLYKVKWTSDSSQFNEIETSIDEEITIPFHFYNSNTDIVGPYNIYAQIVDFSDNLEGEPFKIRVYPTTCLGPEDDSRLGFSSCCDFNSLKTHSELPSITDRENSLVTQPKDSYRSGDSFSQNFYFGLDFGAGDSDLPLGTLFDYTNENLFTTFPADVSSIYQGEISGTCNIYPRWEHNIETVSGFDKNLGEIEEMYFESNVIAQYNDQNSYLGLRPNFDLNLDLIESGSTCNFGIVYDTIFKVLFKEDNSQEYLQFVAGLNYNTVQPIPNQVEFQDVRVLCDDNYKGFQGTLLTSDYDLWSAPLSLNNLNTYRSKGYCSISGDCSLADYTIPSTDSQPNILEGGVCLKTGFDGDFLFSQPINGVNSGPTNIGTLNCVDSYGAIQGTVDLYETRHCDGSNNPTFSCSTYTYDGTCPVGSTPQGIPLDTC